VDSSALGQNPIVNFEKIFTKADISSHAVMITKSLVKLQYINELQTNNKSLLSTGFVPASQER
jgi:hypothetical protein